jgi:hypothetical protein
VRGRRALALIAVAAIAAGCGSQSRHVSAGLPVVVLSSPDASTWVRLLRSSGYAVRVGDLSSLLARTGGIVPGDATLSAADRSRIAAWVARGGRLATPERGLLDELGIVGGAPTAVSAVAMRGLQGNATWAAPLTVTPLAGPKLEPLASSVPSRRIVMALARHGSGEVVGLAVDPAGGGREGWELLPNAGTLVGEELDAPLGPRSESAQIFVDPGGLHNAVDASPTRIAAALARAGARVAEIAGWNYDFTNPADDYDYARLIDALHARGILAYAWLEPPFVTLRLWQDHSECREKTETGRDAFVDWRRLIALEDPRCLAFAEASWRRVLTRYPWDGVNVAELYFEPPITPRNYTPFSKAALRLFGRNPASAPDAFTVFRTRLVTTLNRDVLRFVESLPNARRLALELTVIDDTLDPVLGHGVGSDVRALAAVAQRAGASLVVEDPFTSWEEGPLRYDRLGPHVASLTPPEAALLDVNVVPRAGARPTSQMTGAELGLGVASATAPLGRIAIYALGTLSPQDLAELPGAMGGSTSTTDLGVFGRWTVQVSAPSRRDGRLEVDGIPWPAANGSALVPAGNHVLQWTAGAPLGPGLTGFTGQLGTARVASRSLTFTYDTRPEGLAVVTGRPVSLRVDGVSVRLDVVADPAGGFVVRVPSGTHRAVLGF